MVDMMGRKRFSSRRAFVILDDTISPSEVGVAGERYRLVLETRSGLRKVRAIVYKIEEEKETVDYITPWFTHPRSVEWDLGLWLYWKKILGPSSSKPIMSLRQKSKSSQEDSHG